MLLIKQALKSSLKDKIQLVILIILVALSSILFVSSNTINQRLNSAYNYMGNGEFNYDYSFRYNSLLNYQNTQSITPWTSFTDEKIEVYKKNPDQSYRLEYSLPTISIGAQPDDVLQALKAEYFTISTDGNYIVSFAPGYSMANIYSLNNINLTSKHFQNSLVGKLVNKISITTNDNLKQKYQKDLDNYFKVLQQAPTSFNILQLMQIYAKTNNTTDLNQIVNYLNDDNVTKWSQQIYLDKTDNQIPSNQQGDPNYLFTNKMGGMLGLLVYDN
ncbi:putative ABC-type transport system permease protein [Spiroplasma eriocheiris CCTCC M 207170]|nr:putative ABC-type transport system permease protein [Spiroplasma eriocheiris CCTCC M 207170]